MNWKIGVLVLIAAITLTGCGGGKTSPAATTPSPTTIASKTTTFATSTTTISTPGILTPGQINASMIDQVVKVTGKITLINKDSGGLAVIITGGNGQVMVRVENSLLDKMTAAEKAQYISGNTITVEGMLVKAPGGELTVVVGVKAATTPQMPVIAEAEILAGPVNISHNPTGYRGWSWPRIYTHNSKLVITYGGVAGGKDAKWIVTQEGSGWSQPMEIPDGTPVIGEKGSYVVGSLLHTELQGHIGVAISVLDDNFNLTRKIEVDNTPADHDIDKSSKSLGVVDSKGILHVIWERNTATATDIYYTKYDGAKFTAPLLISNNPDRGSVNPSIAIDSNDNVYAFWGEFANGMYGGTVDIYYSCLQNGKWSAPVNISKTDDWNEFMAVPWYQYSNSAQVNTFFMAILGPKAGKTTQVILKDGKVISSRVINFGFGDITLGNDGDKIYAVFGGMGPISESTSDMWTLKGEVFFNYFDGQDWYAGAGSKILPREFYNNSETLKLDVNTIDVQKQAVVILPDGTTDALREIHPYCVYKDGILYVVFEYNQRGTYDAYFMAIKKK